MSKIFSITIAILSLINIAYCQTNLGYINNQKQLENCINDKIKRINNDSLSLQVIRSFTDTFNVLKKDLRVYGVNGYSSCKVDSLPFFSKDSLECIFFVLTKSDSIDFFGAGRIIKGVRISPGVWQFKQGPQLNLSKLYYNVFPKNGFKEIYIALLFELRSQGITQKNDCSLDYMFWSGWVYMTSPWPNFNS